MGGAPLQGFSDNGWENSSMGLIRDWQRRRRRQETFPLAWKDILREGCGFYPSLPEKDLEELHGHIQVFLAEKVFEGCGGQEITDRLRVLVAAYACLLLLHRSNRCYPLLGTALIYPSSFAAPISYVDAHGVVTEVFEERMGESWDIGTIVLAADCLEGLGTDRGAGLNVILHEFAHQVDFEEGISAGVPLLQLEQDCRDWDALWRSEYRRRRAQRRRKRPQVLDPYGRQSVAEFFAVATESFFERPVRLKAHHPRLYGELQAVYRQDPATWRHVRRQGKS